MKTPFVISEYVRWGDIDLAGIICYGAYLRFYELAETEIFRAAGLPFREMFERFDMWLPRKVMHTEFHSPAVLDEHLKVVTYFSRIGRTSLTINFDVMSADRATLHAAAYQVLVCVKSVPLGQVAGQRLLLSLRPELEQAAQCAQRLADDELSNWSPGLSLLSMQHEVQYSQLYRS